MKGIVSLVIAVIGASLIGDGGAAIPKTGRLASLNRGRRPGVPLGHIVDHPGLGPSNKGPGFKSRLTESGLDFAKEEGLRYLESQLQTLSVADQHGSSSSVIGHINYDFTGIHVTSFHIGSSSLTPNQAEEGLTLRAVISSLGVSGHWHYKTHGFIPISDGGTVDASASSVSLLVTIRVGRDAAGRITLSAQTPDCSFNVGSLNVKFHGGASWLYNLFDKTIARDLKNDLTKQVCSSIVRSVNVDLDGTLQGIPLTLPTFDKVVDIDYALVKDPDFAGSMNLDHKGEFYPRNIETEYPLPNPELPADMDESRMVFFWITEYLANTAGYALQDVGYLRYNMTPEDSGSDDLYTTTFADTYVLPDVADKYPDMPMQISIESTTPPVVTFDPSGVRATVDGHASFYAIKPDNTLGHLFTLGTSIELDVSVALDNNIFTWTASKISADISVESSDINFGFIIPPVLQIEMDAYIDANLLPRLNRQGATGVPLPNLDTYQLVNPIITLGKGYVKIGMDLSL